MAPETLAEIGLGRTDERNLYSRLGGLVAKRFRKIATKPNREISAATGIPGNRISEMRRPGLHGRNAPRWMIVRMIAAGFLSEEEVSNCAKGDAQRAHVAGIIAEAAKATAGRSPGQGWG